jgi:nucleotide-binding universal stress UspA family protein
MTRCMLCGIDQTTGSRHAAAIAARLARDLDSRALLVHVTDGGGFLSRMPLTRMGRRRRTRRALKAVAAEHAFPDGTETAVKTGDPASTLMEIAEREDAELIVVAAGGQWAASAGLLGSVSSTLMRRAPCPVVVVPPDTVAPLDAEGIRSVVCGVAGAETDAALLRLAADLAHRLGGELHAVHAYDPRTPHAADPAGYAAPHDDQFRQSAEQRLALALQQTAADAHGSVLPLPAAEALGRVAEQQTAGLIVVGSSASSDSGSVFVGSVPTKLAAEGRTAVVVLPLATRLEPGSGHYELAGGPARAAA